MLSRRSLLSSSLLSGGGLAGVVGPIEILLSDIGWTGRPDDEAYANRHFAPRVVDPLNLERAIPVVPGGARRSVPTIGDVVIINADGELDTLLTAAVDGRPVRVLQGPRGGPFSAFDTIFKGTTSAWRQADDAQISAGVRDASWQLDVPVTRPTYAGSGSLEGGSDIKGKFRPLAFGELYNIQPVLVDAANLVYQFHSRAALAVTGCYDGGVAFTPAGDVADITAASVSPGQFKTQLSGGYVKLGTAPTKTLTLDVKGDAPAGAYIDRAAEIAFRVLHDFQGLDDSWFESHTFDALRLDIPGAIGIYVGIEAITATEVIDQIMAGVNGWWCSNRLGGIEVGRTSLPLEKPRARLAVKDILDFDMVPLPEAIDPPYWRVRVGYRRNWTPLDVTQIGGSIVSGDPARYAFLTEASRYVTVEDPTVRTRSLRAQEFTLESAFAGEADAQAMAELIFEVYSAPRQMARLRTKRQGYKLPLGATIAVDYPRYGLSGGRNVVVVGQGVAASNVDSFLTVFW
jgi:hypothetical protein